MRRNELKRTNHCLLLCNGLDASADATSNVGKAEKVLELVQFSDSGCMGEGSRIRAD